MPAAEAAGRRSAVRAPRTWQRPQPEARLFAQTKFYDGRLILPPALPSISPLKRRPAPRPATRSKARWLNVLYDRWIGSEL